MLDAQVETRRIGEYTYHVIPLPAGQSLRLGIRAAKIVAPLIGGVSTLAEAKGALGHALVDAIESLDDSLITYLIETLTPTTQVEHGAKKFPLDKVYDEHFRGRLVDNLEWMKFALELNLGPLVARLLKEAGAEVEAVAVLAKA